MFGSTELMTIEAAGGLEDICKSMYNVGFFDYLRRLFTKSAINVSKVKYSRLIKATDNLIKYK